MRLQATADLSKFKGDIASAMRAVERGKEDGLNRAAEVALQAKQRQVGKTYARSIPSGENGKPLWQRKGAWSGGQRIERGTNERTIRTVGAAEKYEAAMANRATGRDGINRSNPASEEAARIVAPQVVAVIQNALTNALKGLR